MKLKDMSEVVDVCNDVISEINSCFDTLGGRDFPLRSAKNLASLFFKNGHIDSLITDSLPISQRVAFIGAIDYLINVQHYTSSPIRNRDTLGILNFVEFIRDKCIYIRDQNLVDTKPVKIFYSWQLSTAGKFNNYFIRDCLHEAVNGIIGDSSIDERDQDVSIEIDSDTKGTSGSPHIFNTIISKIDVSTIFVADVSLLSKKVCNSNVMLELGYAIKMLGFSKIIMVFNAALGDIDDLPFDLRSQRITTYSYKNGDDKGKVSKQLTSVLRTAVSSAL